MRRNNRFNRVRASGPSPALREKVASVSEPDEGPARKRRNKDSFDLAIGTTLARLASLATLLPQAGEGLSQWLFLRITSLSQNRIRAEFVDRPYRI